VPGVTCWSSGTVLKFSGHLNPIGAVRHEQVTLFTPYL
jgi:hypothetical protein